MLGDDSYGEYARRFAERYAAFDPRAQRRAMLRRAEELLADRSSADVAARGPVLLAV
jgi:hypothetical protein